MTDRLRAFLSGEHVPDEQGAEDRARRVVRAAFEQREPARKAWRLRRAVIGVATSLAIVAAALTPPGQAVADWVRDVVGAGEEDVREALESLPAEGRLLVISERGPWIVERNGSKRLLGAYDDASWSPGGLFVVATRGHEIVALDRKGEVRWSIARSGLVRGARWSPDGYRIAYLSGRTLRVVAGDGTGDRPVARGVDTPPAWRPGTGHELTFVDSERRLNLVATDSKLPFQWRSAGAVDATRIAWSADGRRLLAMTTTGVRLFDERGRRVATIELPSGVRAEAAEFAPSGHAFALASRNSSTGRSRLALVGPRSRILLFSGAGRFSDLAWSPDGHWLLASWPEADQWVFVRAGRTGRGAGVERLRAVANISDQFAPGAATQPAFPRIGGWCCP